MRKFMNDPAEFADHALDGLVLAFPDRVRRLSDEPRAIVRTDLDRQDRVVIATGGGSGHLPLFAGYVVRGLADGCAVGNMFASPSAEVMLAVTEAIDRGKGVLYLYGNYGGDRINFGTAAELADDSDIAVASVRACDDVLSAPPANATQRRGIAGILFGYIVAAGVARTGAGLDAVATATQHALDRTRSIGVALTGPILPTVGHANFELADDQMEIGTGIHGEPGVRRGPLLTADAIVAELVPQLVTELGIGRGDRVAVLVNGLGATPAEELYILFRAVHALLTDAGVDIGPVLVGEYAASLEMAGASISLLHLDNELEQHVASFAGSEQWR